MSDSFLPLQLLHSGSLPAAHPRFTSFAHIRFLSSTVKQLQVRTFPTLMKYSWRLCIINRLMCYSPKQWVWCQTWKHVCSMMCMSQVFAMMGGNYSTVQCPWVNLSYIIFPYVSPCMPCLDHISQLCSSFCPRSTTCLLHSHCFFFYYLFISLTLPSVLKDKEMHQSSCRGKHYVCDCQLA